MFSTLRILSPDLLSAAQQKKENHFSPGLQQSANSRKIHTSESAMCARVEITLSYTTYEPRRRGPHCPPAFESFRKTYACGLYRAQSSKDLEIFQGTGLLVKL